MSACELLVVSVTKLSDGVCVACLNAAGRWVRPTRENARGWRQLEVADLRDARERVVVEVDNVVRWPLGAKNPRDVHTEDFEVAGRPSLVRTLGPDEFRARCMNMCDRSLRAFLRSADRSLTILEPQSVKRIEFERGQTDEISARLTFEIEGAWEDLSVTDLRWRVLGRSLLGTCRPNRCVCSHEMLERRARRRIRFLAIGRGQAWQGHEHPLAGEFWPFVTTVFTDPPTIEPIDYACL